MIDATRTVWISDGEYNLFLCSLPAIAFRVVDGQAFLETMGQRLALPA
jgi:hypothetical protein